jgi:hypothetical protein
MIKKLTFSGGSILEAWRIPKPKAHLLFYVAGMPHRIQCTALPTSLSPQRGEGMRVRGGYAPGSGKTKAHRAHPGPLPVEAVEGRGRSNAFVSMLKT